MPSTSAGTYGAPTQRHEERWRQKGHALYRTPRLQSLEPALQVLHGVHRLELELIEIEHNQFSFLAPASAIFALRVRHRVGPRLASAVFLAPAGLPLRQRREVGPRRSQSVRVDQLSAGRVVKRCPPTARSRPRGTQHRLPRPENFAHHTQRLVAADGAHTPPSLPGGRRSVCGLCGASSAAAAAAPRRLGFVTVGGFICGFVLAIARRYWLLAKMPKVG
jgi:hypothetical protein